MRYLASHLVSTWSSDTEGFLWFFSYDDGPPGCCLCFPGTTPCANSAAGLIRVRIFQWIDWLRTTEVKVPKVGNGRLRPCLKFLLSEYRCANIQRGRRSRWAWSWHRLSWRDFLMCADRPLCWLRTGSACCEPSNARQNHHYPAGPLHKALPCRNTSHLDGFHFPVLSSS